MKSNYLLFIFLLAAVVSMFLLFKGDKEMPRMKFTSPQGLEFIKDYEKLHTTAYIDAVGVPTIGWGSTMFPNKKTVGSGDVITEWEADRMLVHYVTGIDAELSNIVTTPLTQNEFDALSSFVYNVGLSGFKKSTMLKLLNQGDKQGAAQQFSRWVYGGGKKLPGLVKRRNQEAAMFVKGVYDSTH